jgi:hypothetical protein
VRVQSEKMASPAANLSLTIPVTPIFWRDMMSTWRKHLIICLFLGLLAVPIYFLDVASTQQGAAIGVSAEFSKHRLIHQKKSKGLFRLTIDSSWPGDLKRLRRLFARKIAHDFLRLF